jgi:hypothetical protein
MSNTHLIVEVVAPGLLYPPARPYSETCYQCNKDTMKHQNTTYRYAQGGFGQISIDLVKDVIVKCSRKASDTSLRNEALAYKVLEKQSTHSEHILQTVSITDDRIELERADCDLGFFTQNTQQAEAFHLLVAV